ncbi:MAG: hypothetical protein IJU39_06990 [Clostridia bacterium]|nr:hypothetical protein [Clostridia bacterium]
MKISGSSPEETSTPWLSISAPVRPFSSQNIISVSVIGIENSLGEINGQIAFDSFRQYFRCAVSLIA